MIITKQCLLRVSRDHTHRSKLLISFHAHHPQHSHRQRRERNNNQIDTVIDIYNSDVYNRGIYLLLLKMITFIFSARTWCLVPAFIIIIIIDYIFFCLPLLTQLGMDLMSFWKQSNSLLYISSRGDIIVMVNWKHCHQLTQTTLILVQPNRNFFVKWNPIQYYKN